MEIPNFVKEQLEEKLKDKTETDIKYMLSMTLIKVRYAAERIPEIDSGFLDDVEKLYERIK